MRYINRVAEFRDAVNVAKDADLVRPQWADRKCSLPDDIIEIAQRAIDVYLLSKKHNGQMGGIGWWQSANGYTAMTLYDLWARNHDNYEVLDELLRLCESIRSDFVNEFNDDTLWWAMCCVHMYSLHGDSWYLLKAKHIWQYIRNTGSICKKGDCFFIGQDMEGAVYWTTRPGEDQLNAISTGLYAELSTRLALIQSNDSQAHNPNDPDVEDYTEAARLSLGWILRCRYQAREGLVLDHIKLKEQKAVDWKFTYNTGVTLGTCALLYEVTGEEEYLVLACHMALKAMTREIWVVANGVLTESSAYGRGTHDPLKSNDAVGFKAVLIRQLCTLYNVVHKTHCPMQRAQYVARITATFLNINVQSQLERNTNGKDQYGPWWNGPFEYPTSHSQMASLDVLTAAVLLHND